MKPYQTVSTLLTFSLLLVSLCCVACSKESSQGAKSTSPAVLTASTQLGTISPDEQPVTQTQDPKHAGTPPDKAPAHIVIDINKAGRGYAYIARVGDTIHVVHNGRTGKAYQEVDANTLTLSPDGQRVAYGARAGEKWFVVADAREYGPFDEIGPPSFSPDSRVVAFEGKSGTSWHIHLGDRKSPPAPSFFSKPLFSADSSRMLRLENTGDEKQFRHVFSDLAFGGQVVVPFSSFNITVNEQLSRIAVIDRPGDKYQVKLMDFMNPTQVAAGSLYDGILKLAFSSDGRHVAYIAQKGKGRFLVYDGKEEAIPSGEYPWPPVIRPDHAGVGLVIVGKTGAFIHEAFSGQKIPVPSTYKECADLAYSRDGRYHAYVAIRNEKFLIVANGQEGPVYDRVISPQFSPDGRFLIYRARQDGMRFVVVADAATGKILRELPRYERVFETTFTADGQSVAYGVKDGNQIWWKVEKL